MGPGKRWFLGRRWDRGGDGVGEKMWAREKTFFKEKKVSLGMEKEMGLGIIRSLRRRHVPREIRLGKIHSPWRRWVEGGDGVKERMWVGEDIP